MTLWSGNSNRNESAAAPAHQLNQLSTTIQPLDDVPRLLQHARLLKVGIAHRHIDIRVAKDLPDLLNVERVTSSGSQGNV